jgi:hypothetical protein
LKVGARRRSVGTPSARSTTEKNRCDNIGRESERDGEIVEEKGERKGGWRGAEEKRKLR